MSGVNDRGDETAPQATGRGQERCRLLPSHSCDLQTRLQDQEEEHQEAQKAKEADVEKLNQALCLCYKVKEGPESGATRNWGGSTGPLGATL